MIDLILKMLDINKMHGVSKNIDIAKGSNKIPTTLREGFNQFKRSLKWL
jgi:hypothetical protein|tara:strand:- start:369 stop:515 length:147 start_codon:yes stop_codon:yes gene_type:complete